MIRPEIENLHKYVLKNVNNFKFINGLNTGMTIELEGLKISHNQVWKNHKNGLCRDNIDLTKQESNLFIEVINNIYQRDVVSVSEQKEKSFLLQLGNLI